MSRAVRANEAAAKRLADRPLRSIYEVFGKHDVTDEEWRQLIWHLATIRMRRTIEVLADRPPRIFLAVLREEPHP